MKTNEMNGGREEKVGNANANQTPEVDAMGPGEKRQPKPESRSHAAEIAYWR